MKFIKKSDEETLRADLEVKKEIAILIGLQLSAGNEEEAAASLEELAQLAGAAGVAVGHRVLQKKAQPSPATYIGKGLAEQIALEAKALGATLIISDDELSGTQVRNLEELTGLRVIDRSALILDIFASRARSKEGKLQVELAQLRYYLPRLAGMGENLSRLAGGIGTRGPGETKLESDRRVIRRRITEIERRLSLVQAHRRVLRDGRKGSIPVGALVGYTNAGKSSLRYALMHVAGSSRVHWETEDRGQDQLFATLDPTVRGILLRDGQQVLLGDTVGFIQKLPGQLVSAFKATLEEVVEANFLLHVVDVSNPRFERQMDAVENVLKDLGCQNKPRLTVYNKIDLLPPALMLLPPPDHSKYVGVSSVTGAGIDELLAAVAALVSGIGSSNRVKLDLPYQEASLLSELYGKGQVTAVRYNQHGMEVEALVQDELFQRLKAYVRNPEL